MKMRMTIVLLLSLGFFGLATAAPARADDIRTERVQFPKGKTGTRIKGHIKGCYVLTCQPLARSFVILFFDSLLKTICC
jgi:hypothetical protein